MSVEKEKEVIEKVKSIIEDLKDEIDAIKNDKFLIAQETEKVETLQNILKLVKDLKDENDFLRFMYKGTEEYKAVERYASGDHIPRID